MDWLKGLGSMTGLTAHAAFGIADKRDQIIELFERTEIILDLFDRMRFGQPRMEQRLEGFTQHRDGGLRELSAFKSDDIDPEYLARIAVAHGIRRHILDDFGTSSNDGHGADTNELVNTGKASDDSPVLEGHVASQCAEIRHDAIVPDLAVMRHMGIGHEEIAVPDDSLTATLLCTAIDGHVFAENILGTNLKCAIFPANVLFILRGAAYDRTSKELAFGANDRIAGDHTMIADRDILCDRDIAVDNGIGTD